ncbi:MAG: low temperature requirement protein A [Chloroflexi bacterium]|nr:low temperature requirement protein A [Chloroflexota bacterium]
MAVWRAWVDTAWVTNWFDPDRTSVRLLLIGVMLASLLMSAALPEAFGERGLLFAGAFVAIQVGRVCFVVASLGGEPGMRRNFQRILAWCVFSGVLWLARGFAHGTARELLWLGAVAIDVAAPAVGFITPGLGRSGVADWNITGSHLAERCQLFLIVALGESILLTGATFAGREMTPGTAAAVLFAFAGSVATWWIYFDRAAGWAAAAITTAADPGRLGRSAYTYCHLPMVAGIIVTAVGDELTIAHPGGHGSAALTLVALGGPALFLAGYSLFKWAVAGRTPSIFVIAIGALAVVAPASMHAAPLLTSAAATIVLVAVATWNHHAARSALAVQQEPAGEELPV